MQKYFCKHRSYQIVRKNFYLNFKFNVVHHTDFMCLSRKSTWFRLFSLQELSTPGVVVSILYGTQGTPKSIFQSSPPCPSISPPPGSPSSLTFTSLCVRFLPAFGTVWNMLMTRECLVSLYVLFYFYDKMPHWWGLYYLIFFVKGSLVRNIYFEIINYD